jgi:hypothetical protein
MAGLLAVAFVVKMMVDLGMPFREYIVLQFLIAGLIYTLIVMVAVLVKPIIIGINREDVNAVLANLRKMLKF